MTVGDLKKILSVIDDERPLMTCNRCDNAYEDGMYEDLRLVSSFEIAPGALVFWGENER